MRFRVAVQGITYHLGGGYTHLDDFVPTGDPSRQSIPSLYGGLQFRRGFVTVDVSGRHYRNRIPATLNPDILRSGFTPLSQPLYEMNDQTNEALGARVLVTPVSWLRHQTAVGIDRQALSAFQTRRRFTTPVTLCSPCAATGLASCPSRRMPRRCLLHSGLSVDL